MQTRDYVFVGDVVKANEMVLILGENSIYNIGTGIETNVNELFQMIVKKSGKSIPEKHGEAKPGEQLRSVLDYSLIKNKLSWEPAVDLAEGITRTVGFFKSKYEN